MEARLASSVLVSALLKLASRDGGFGAVLAKGDAQAGSVTVILMERGERRMVLERIVQPDGSYGWQESGITAPRTTKSSESSWIGGGDSTRICGYWNWTSHQPNGSPTKWPAWLTVNRTGCTHGSTVFCKSGGPPKSSKSGRARRGSDRVHKAP
jgi:hypothetical protein